MIDAKDIRNLSEAYLSVYSSTEEIDEADSLAAQQARRAARQKANMKKHGTPGFDYSKTPEQMKKFRDDQFNKFVGSKKGIDEAKKELPTEKIKKQIERKVDSDKPKDWYNAGRMMGATGVKVKTEDYDLYDLILSHLLDEGYAETEEAAEAIMVSMSEDWRESIIEEFEELDEETKEERWKRLNARTATPAQKRQQERARKGREVLADIQATEKALKAGRQPAQKKPEYNTPPAEVRVLKPGQKKDTLALKAKKAMGR